jgi:hypothetical protein
VPTQDSLIYLGVHYPSDCRQWHIAWGSLGAFSGRGIGALDKGVRAATRTLHFPAVLRNLSPASSAEIILASSLYFCYCFAVKAPPEKPEAPDPTLTAGDVKNATGMSYRQLNDWDSKGALPGQREQEAGWRKFTPREIFAIMVCREIRSRFGTSLESLRWVQNFMLQDGADHLHAALDIMRFGFAVFILTDLKKTFVMDSDIEFDDLFHYGYLRGSEDQAYVFIQVNHLVNRLLACLKTPVALRIHDRNYEVVRQARAEIIAHSAQEIAVIRAIRHGEYRRVILTKKNDEDMVLEVEQELPASETAKADVTALLNEHEYQTVTVSRAGGKNVRVKRTLPLPLKRKQKR